MNVIGLDVGATKTIGIVFDGKKIIKALSIVTPHTEAEFRRSIGKLLEFLADNLGIAGVGIGMAGLMDSKRQVAVTSPNLKFVKNFDWKKFLTSGGIANSALDNDADVFLRGELGFGMAKKYKNVIAVTLGTGIGGAMAIEGKVYRGANNFGGEVGRMVMGNSFWEALFQKARDKRDFKTVSYLTAQGFANLINIFDPEMIVIGGGFGVNESKYYLSQTKKLIPKYLQNKKAKVQIVTSKLKYAAALGAASMVI